MAKGTALVLSILDELFSSTPENKKGSKEFISKLYCDLATLLLTAIPSKNMERKNRDYAKKRMGVHPWKPHFVRTFLQHSGIDGLELMSSISEAFGKTEPNSTRGVRLSSFVADETAASICTLLVNHAQKMTEETTKNADSMTDEDTTSEHANKKINAFWTLLVSLVLRKFSSLSNIGRNWPIVNVLSFAKALDKCQSPELIKKSKQAEVKENLIRLMEGKRDSAKEHRNVNASKRLLAEVTDNFNLFQSLFNSAAFNSVQVEKNKKKNTAVVGEKKEKNVNKTKKKKKKRKRKRSVMIRATKAWTISRMSTTKKRIRRKKAARTKKKRRRKRRKAGLPSDL